jgi:hypothetical protein
MSFSQATLGEDSVVQLPLSESEKTTGHVKNKIKSQNRPNRGSRARKEWRGSLAKVIKKAESIAELLTGDDQEENLRVIREAKLATHRVYDFELKKGIDVPDHKTRLAATMLDLAYREGKPVERQISAHADAKDFPELLRRLQQSEAYKAIEDSEQKTVQGKEVPPALPDAAREESEQAE